MIKLPFICAQNDHHYLFTAIICWLLFVQELDRCYLESWILSNDILTVYILAWVTKINHLYLIAAEIVIKEPVLVHQKAIIARLVYLKSLNTSFAQFFRPVNHAFKLVLVSFKSGAIVLEQLSQEKILTGHEDPETIVLQCNWVEILFFRRQLIIFVFKLELVHCECLEEID